MASIAYSEQVGRKRQAGGNIGEIQYLYRRMGKMAMPLANLIMPYYPVPSAASGKTLRRTRREGEHLPGGAMEDYPDKSPSNGNNSASTMAKVNSLGFKARLGTTTISLPGVNPA